jgi:hypothetical protein
MATKVAEKKAEELAFLTEWCSVILTTAFGKESGAPAEMYSSLEDLVTQMRKKDDLRGMRSIAKELVGMAGALSEDKWHQLDESLRLKFGKGLREEADREAAKVDQILKRGKIRGEADYRLLHTRADQIFADESKKNELEKINDLLGAEHRKWP